MQIEDVTAGHPAEIVKLFDQIRQLILSLDDRIDEAAYGGKVVKMISFSVARADNVVAVLGPAKGHCKLFLHYPDDIDAQGLKLVGKGKHARHVKLRPEDDLDESVIKFVVGQVLAIVLTKV